MRQEFRGGPFPTTITHRRLVGWPQMVPSQDLGAVRGRR